jgi:hypothetical protein
MGDYNYDGKMSIEQFDESFWIFIDERLVSNMDIESNRDWADTLVHDAWRMYVASNVDHGYIFKILENTIYAYKRYQPNFKG